MILQISQKDIQPGLMRKYNLELFGVQNLLEYFLVSAHKNSLFFIKYIYTLPIHHILFDNKHFFLHVSLVTDIELIYLLIKINCRLSWLVCLTF